MNKKDIDNYSTLSKHLEKFKISMDELIDGALYFIHARNADFGIWDASVNGFHISRHKFSDNFHWVEDHWDTGAPHGTASPLMKLDDEVPNFKFTGQYPSPTDEAEFLEFMNEFDKKYNAVKMRNDIIQAKLP